MIQFLKRGNEEVSSDYTECLNLSKEIIGTRVFPSNPVNNGLMLNLVGALNNGTSFETDNKIWKNLVDNYSISVSNAIWNYEKALIFNGIDTQFDSGIGQGSLTNGYTIVLRINPTEWKNYRGIFGFHNNTKGISGLQYNNGVITAINIGGSNVIAFSTEQLSVNKWHIVTIVNDEDGNGRAYINGKLIASVTGYGKLTALGNVIIGRANNSADRYFKGKMSHCLIYNRALNGEEVKQINNYVINTI